MRTEKTVGHLAAIATMLVWGTTYIATKVLLDYFKPLEILVLRFAIGFAALWILHPHRMKVKEKKHELLLALAGLSGVCLYFLFQNIALSYTMASNVGVIISAAPFFTALFSHLFLKGQERLRASFFVGFLMAIAGIALISFNGARMQINPVGDLLTLLAAALWGVYSVLTDRTAAAGYGTLESTRRIFGWGLVFMIPALFFMDFSPSVEALIKPANLFNILFLGIGASALCFVSWNFALRRLGTIRSSGYIYLEPVVTVITAVILLGDPLTPYTAAGTLLTLGGLVVSEMKLERRKK